MKTASWFYYFKVTTAHSLPSGARVSVSTIGILDGNRGPNVPAESKEQLHGLTNTKDEDGAHPKDLRTWVGVVLLSMRVRQRRKKWPLELVSRRNSARGKISSSIAVSYPASWQLDPIPYNKNKKRDE